jgi:hypothetical protein
MIKIVKGAEVDGPRGEAGGKRHGVFAYHADPELYPLVGGFSRQPRYWMPAANLNRSTA